jgi:hypothetical protein
MSRLPTCCETVAVLWLRQKGVVVSVLKREIIVSDVITLDADDEHFVRYLVNDEGYIRRPT